MLAKALGLNLLLAAAPVFAAVQELWWNITYVEGVEPDGLGTPRRVIGVNGTWPPPPVHVKDSNDTLRVHVTNNLDEPTSHHFHGLFFNSTSWYDGAMGITQCGIPVNETFTYEIPIGEYGQHGTFWNHAHARGQYVDGLRSPTTISRKGEEYEYDDDYTVILGDWYYEKHSKLMLKFISRANPGGAEPVPDSSLIYFAKTSEASYLPPIPGTTSGAGNVGFNENATLPFTPGKTYRLRFINTSGFAMFMTWIDGHDMDVIEVDGIDTERFPVDMLTITVAQRYSVLVKARNDTLSNFAIHANMDVDMFDTIPDGLNPNRTASITYNASAPLVDLGFVDEYQGDVMPDIDMVPLDKIPQFGAPDKVIETEVIFDTMDDGTNRAMFNQITYNYPTTPTLFSALSLGPNATYEPAYGPLSFTVDHLQTVDIIIKNGDAGKHPFHLHGHRFQIIHRADDYLSDDPELNPPLVEGQANPMRRDTVQVASGGSVRLRFIADNPGVWLLHCHIEWHLEAGLALTLVEAPFEMQKRAELRGPPSFMADHCKALGLPTTGNAAGNSNLDDLTGLRVGPFPQNNGWHPKGIAAMFGCVLTAVIGMATVVWYTYGGELSEEEAEAAAQRNLDAKAGRGKLWGLIPGQKA